MVSNCLSLLALVVRMERNEKKHENESNNAITEVNSSTILVAEVFEMCNEVITKRQKPKRFAAVFKICSDILFAIKNSATKIVPCC